MMQKTKRGRPRAWKSARNKAVAILRKRLTETGQSVRQFADDAEVNYQTLNEILRGRRALTINTLYRLAPMCGLTPDELRRAEMERP